MSPFNIIAPIDWARIARAHRFYTAKGLIYRETPWVVPLYEAQVTMPPDANPFFVTSKTPSPKQVLVGSAEQGFVSLFPSLSPDKLYFSISPCFRGESLPLEEGVKQLTFMKVELFSRGEADEWSQLIHFAQEFMEQEGVATKQVKTSSGYDLVTYSGMELGSYGKREEGRFKLHYGTGLAEPRFSTALKEKSNVV